MTAWGSDVNAQDLSGLTPLHLAVKSSEENKSSRSVKILLIKGADRNLKDNFNRKPIDIAKFVKNETIRKELLSYLVSIYHI